MKDRTTPNGNFGEWRWLVSFSSFADCFHCDVGCPKVSFEALGVVLQVKAFSVFNLIVGFKTVWCYITFPNPTVVSICLFACLSFCLFVFLSFCLFVFLSFCLFVFLSFCLFVFLSLYPFVSLSFCFFVFKYFCILVNQ